MRRIIRFTGPIARYVPGLLMEDDIPTATELLESEASMFTL